MYDDHACSRAKEDVQPLLTTHESCCDAHEVVQGRLLALSVTTAAGLRHVLNRLMLSTSSGASEHLLVADAQAGACEIKQAMCSIAWPCDDCVCRSGNRAEPCSGGGDNQNDSRCVDAMPGCVRSNKRSLLLVSEQRIQTHHRLQMWLGDYTAAPLLVPTCCAFLLQSTFCGVTRTSPASSISSSKTTSSPTCTRCCCSPATDQGRWQSRWGTWRTQPQAAEFPAPGN